MTLKNRMIQSNSSEVIANLYSSDLYSTIEPIPSKIANVKMSSCERDTVSMNCQQKYNAFNSINVFKTPNLFVGKKLNKVGVVFLVKLRRKIRLITCLWLLKPHLAI